MTSETAIDVNELVAHYGEKRALAGVSLSMNVGEWAVLAGPNGSGKSTLMKVLLGMLIPTSGTSHVLRHESRGDRLQVRKCAGYLPEDTYFYQELSAEEHLRFAGEMHGVPKAELTDRIGELLALLKLEEAARRPLNSYSLGMKRKVGLAMAMIHQPSVLILDEPFNGIDPVTTQECRELLRKRCDDGGLCILMATHNFGMLESYADTVFFIYDGAILESGNPPEIHANHDGRTFDEIFIELVKLNQTGG